MAQLAAVMVLSLALASMARAGEWDLGGDIALEVRTFPRSPLFPEQDHATVSPSLRLEPEIVYEWNNALDRITFTPFLRLDAHDSNRTHFDVRELNWIRQAETWSLLVGAGKAFWGVTESRHLVDIINQTDLVEDIDEEDKLGQPMLNLTLERSWGAIDLYVLPYFRERTFPDGDARLRGAVPISGNPSYESSLEEWHPDFAIRYSHTIGDFDFGVGHFWGTSREPRFLPRPRGGGLTLRAHYDVINQTSLDVQWTRDAWLWKLELIGRVGDRDDFAAAVGGFEYTLYQIFETPADLGLLVEYLYDGRSEDPSKAPPTRFDRDVFAGFRLALNNVADTAVLGGAIVDTRTSEIFVLLEAAHRLGDRWLIELETRWLLNTDRDGLAGAFRRDSFATLRLSWFF